MPCLLTSSDNFFSCRTRGTRDSWSSRLHDAFAARAKSRIIGVPFGNGLWLLFVMGRMYALGKNIFIFLLYFLLFPLRPKQELNITSEVSGRSKNVLVDIGDSVPADRAGVELDKTFIMLDLQKNRIAQEEVGRQLELKEKRRLPGILP